MIDALLLFISNIGQNSLVSINEIEKHIHVLFAHEEFFDERKNESATKLRPSTPFRESRPLKFSLITGSWWLDQKPDIKFGFLIGEEDCYLSKVYKKHYINPPGIYSNINGSYLSKIDNLIKSDEKIRSNDIISIIRSIMRYHENPNKSDFRQIKFGYYSGLGNGTNWALLNDYEMRYGYVYGYLICANRYFSAYPKLDIAKIENIVSDHYGLVNTYSTDDEEQKIKKGTKNDKIDDIIDSELIVLRPIKNQK